MKLFFILFLLAACGKEKSDHELTRSEKVEKVEELQARRLASIDLSTRGWALPNSCDGFLYSALFAAADPSMCEKFDWKWAEDDQHQGKLHRRGRLYDAAGEMTQNYCWTEETGDIGAKADWSRDMGVGAFAYGWRCKNLEFLSRHMRHCEENSIAGVGCRMGDPIADGRTVYTPQIMGEMYQAIYALDSARNSFGRFWPHLYPDDFLPGTFQVHLLLISIAMRGEIASYQGDDENVPSPKEETEQKITYYDDSYELTTVLKISSLMFKRIKKYADEDLDNVLAWSLYGVYSGDYNHALDLCISGTVAEHANDEPYKTVELAFSCGLMLRQLK